MRSLPWRAAGIVSLGAWAYLAFFRSGFWRLRTKLEPARTPTRTAGRVTAANPERNEEDVITYPVRSLRDHVHFIVSDDESDDATSDVARADGAEVIRVSPRPCGWK